LSLSAGISQRQLSFIESGRARLGRDTVLHLAEALNLLFERHEPNPALLVDRQTNFLCANRAASRVFGQYGDLESMLRKCCGSGSPNLLRLSFHPDGLRAPIMLMRARQEAAVSGNEALLKLLDEVMAYPGVADACHITQRSTKAPPTLTLDLEWGERPLRLFSMFSSFGWPQDLLTDELRIESFFPADAESAKLLNDLAARA